MTTDTNGRDLSYNAIVHVVFATFGGVAIGGLMFCVCYALAGILALLTMMGAAFSPWIGLFDSLIWALVLWLLFFFVSKPEFEIDFTPRRRYTIVAAFMGGGMLPWMYLIFLLFMGSGIKNWQQFVAILIAPPLGYVIAACVHTATKNHYPELYKRMARETSE